MMKTNGSLVSLVLVIALLALANVTSAEEAIRLSNAEMDSVTAGASNHLGSSIRVEVDGIRAEVGGGTTRIEVDGIPVAVGKNRVDFERDGHHIVVASEKSHSATAIAKGSRSATAIAVAHGKSHAQ